MNLDFVYRGESKDLDDTVRAQTSGSFIKLADGYTHYEFSGPSSGQAVVLVHGFSVPYFIWDPTFGALTSAGYRVLRYDLYGRGFSDRPRIVYDINLFVRQLIELIEALDFKKIDLIGLSMGGVISAAFTTRYPEHVQKLILIDPIGTQGMPLSLLYKVAVLPGLSELILGLVGTENMVKAVASDFFDPKLVAMFQEKYRPQMQYKGFKRAILSTIRNKVVDGFPEVYQRLGKMDLPVLLLWGRNDQTLPLGQSSTILAAVPTTEFKIIDHCGHIPHYEKPEVVNPILLEFLRSK